ncbi:MAG: SDR family NAD(P)-dependent oxidoreductase [Chitinivibrionales bacterium]|nr:SDR family NAD(P)-dependent oxidoreductase [Chitinivibrionales bacterium]MBD3396840.1 SDR family NAD(P)-dependent oxidoreductase [Chitinivibrionales bacterium]
MFDELFDLSARVALVTGASRGLGRTFAETLARAGAHVAVCSRSSDHAAAVAREIADFSGTRTFGAGADVTKKADIQGLLSSVEEELGPVDILVTCAGINIRKDTQELTEQDWDTLVDSNLKGSFLVAQAILPGMRQRKQGRIVFLGSALSFISIAGRAAYASSKTAILGLARTLALEAARDNVCVNALCPGPFTTPMNAPLLEDERNSRAFVSAVPMARWGNPDELRGMLLYLCSPACSYQTGSAVLVDGGWTVV